MTGRSLLAAHRFPLTVSCLLPPGFLLPVPLRSEQVDRIPIQRDPGVSITVQPWRSGPHHPAEHISLALEQHMPAPTVLDT